MKRDTTRRDQRVPSAGTKITVRTVFNSFPTPPNMLILNAFNRTTATSHRGETQPDPRERATTAPATVTRSAPVERQDRPQIGRILQKKSAGSELVRPSTPRHARPNHTNHGETAVGGNPVRPPMCSSRRAQNGRPHTPRRTPIATPTACFCSTKRKAPQKSGAFTAHAIPAAS